ncbi:plasmid replication initiator TrfA [Cupriavidus pinatubonensis]|uniref:Plasmid replication initiator protein TrfA n=1 Tax=Cupriavidus pinatubonensis TaxID=248026 RepID=A0ABM8WEP8_9BURK|nr:plasmid replication initiator TrfA [Cupriavidus pinatubonensis]CAG9165805.1 Plasmid replication initiator protein TrfA [Cupriavidus pinatubonensis]
MAGTPTTKKDPLAAMRSDAGTLDFDRVHLVHQEQLPMWPEDDRAFPNSMARSAIFAAVTGPHPREFYKQPKVLASLSNYVVTYQGAELRQDDLTVFSTLLHLARQTKLGHPVRFTAYSMLKELGWSINSDEYAHLRECCERLQFTSLKITTNKGAGGYAGSLIAEFHWKDDSGNKLDEWYVVLAPTIAAMFGPETYTLQSWSVRKKIGGRSPLAQWLHFFLGSHDEPIPISVGKYHELSGSKSKNLDDFRRRLKAALQKLIDVGFLKSFRIAEDLVHVEKDPKYRSKGGRLKLA